MSVTGSYTEDEPYCVAELWVSVNKPICFAKKKLPMREPEVRKNYSRIWWKSSREGLKFGKRIRQALRYDDLS